MLPPIVILQIVFNGANIGTQFTCFTGTKVEILTLRSAT